MENAHIERKNPDRGVDWRNRAACIVEDPELFFPVGTTGPALSQINEAKKVCKGCTVRDICLQWALANDEWGVWGGTTQDERRSYKRRHRVGRSVLQNQLNNKIA